MNKLSSLYPFLEGATKWPLKKPFLISPKIYPQIVKLQSKDTFPSLLVFKQGRNAYLARVK